MPEPGAPKPDDVPDEWVQLLLAAANDAWVDLPRFEAGRLLAAVVPAIRKAVLTELLGPPEEIAARKTEADARTPDDTVRLCEMARPGEHARRVLTAAADQLDAIPETDGAALKGPYWYRDGWKQATSMLRDWADYPAALAGRIARGETR